MRGKVVIKMAATFLTGITPAYAGKSAPAGKVCYLDRDHPRLCGEKRHYPLAFTSSLGSPPPMRGKGADGKSAYQIAGITPAYAGKSFCVVSVLCWNQDHPRLCGEKLTLAMYFFISLGSPPPMRGKVRAKQRFKSVQGITPAYAGKSALIQSFFIKT